MARHGTDSLGSYDVVVLGGGTAGAAVAGLLAEGAQLSVALVEAGPDYGPADGGRWPADLLDPLTLALTHDWGYDSAALLPGRILPFERARVIGGCSAHNGCAQTAGSRRDYDDWGLDGCDAAALKPCFARAAARLRLRHYTDDELTPFHRAVLEGLMGCGIPRTDDFLDLDGGVGCGAEPVSIAAGVRWNSAFAYLDRVRRDEGLRIFDDALVERLELRAGRVRGAEVIRDGVRHTITADRFVISAGTYGSPGVLLRSGIGAPETLAGMGVATIIPLRGVGRNLHDQPTVQLQFEASSRLVKDLLAFGADRPLPDEQVLAKARSDGAAEPFDLHVLPWTEPRPDGSWVCHLPVACLTPRSRGTLTLPSARPDAVPLIDHAYLSDPDGADRDVLRAGIELCAELAASAPLAPLLGAPIGDPDVFAHYWHPVGTCAMGDSPDAGAVVDSSGRVFGCENLWVVDASIIPTVPRATTNLPVVALTEHLADGLARG